MFWLHSDRVSLEIIPWTLNKHFSQCSCYLHFYAPFRLGQCQYYFHCKSYGNRKLQIWMPFLFSSFIVMWIREGLIWDVYSNYFLGPDSQPFIWPLPLKALLRVLQNPSPLLVARISNSLRLSCTFSQISCKCYSIPKGVITISYDPERSAINFFRRHCHYPLFRIK